jgi:hypothetical protein
VDVPKSVEEVFAHQEFIRIVADALAQTISHYAKIPTVAGAAVLKTSLESNRIDVGGFICFDSPDFTVEIFIGIPLDLYAIYYENIAQEKLVALSSENQDLAGELLNIAFGTVDPKTRQPDFQLRSSFPKTLIGPPLAAFIKSLPVGHVSVPLNSAGKDFLLWIFPKDAFKQSWSYTPKRL